jgi:hypothetical protein
MGEQSSTLGEHGQSLSSDDVIVPLAIFRFAKFKHGLKGYNLKLKHETSFTIYGKINQVTGKRTD